MALLSFLTKKAKEAPKKVAEATLETSSDILKDASTQITGVEPVKPINPHKVEVRKQQEEIVGGRKAAKTEQELEEMRRTEELMRDPVYFERVKELRSIYQNSKSVKITKEAQTAENALMSSHQRFKQEQFNTAQGLSSTKQQSAQDEYKERTAREEEEKQQKKQSKIASMSQPVEVQGKVTGVGFRRKASTRLQPPKSSETKAGQGIGG